MVSSAVLSALRSAVHNSPLEPCVLQLASHWIRCRVQLRAAIPLWCLGRRQVHDQLSRKPGKQTSLPERNLRLWWCGCSWSFLDAIGPTAVLSRLSTLETSCMTSDAGAWTVETRASVRTPREAEAFCFHKFCRWVCSSYHRRQTVAFHAFKQVDKWYNCWLLSENDGY